VSGCGRKAKPVETQAKPTALATPVQCVRAEQGDMYVTENLTGTVEPNHQVDVQTEIAGQVSWVGPDVGDRVTKGQAIVRLDTALVASSVNQSAAAVAAAKARYGQSRVGLQLTEDQTKIAVRQAENNMETARNRLRQTKTSADLTRSRVEDAISQARTGVHTAEAQLADVKAGSRSQEINQAQARVDQAQAALRLAKVNLGRMQSLVTSGAVAQSQVDSAQLEYDNAVGNLRVATQALDLAREGARTEQVRLAELNVVQAKQVLSQTESQRGQIDVAERDVRAAEVALDQAQESVRLARAQRAQVAATAQDVRAAKAAVQQAGAADTASRTQLRKHVIYAPASGIVASRNVEPGQSASPGTPLVRIVNLNPVRVSCDASELQVGQFRVGQEAEVRVDALQGQQFVGRITDIAPQVRQGERIFAVRIDVPNPQGTLRAGMFARIAIVTALHRNTVIVPRDVLVERGERRVVYAVEGNKIDVRQVTMGASEDGRTEVTSGVRAGDMLVYGGQSLLAQGQLVEPQIVTPGALMTGTAPVTGAPAAGSAAGGQ
jgi:RND family efflux transporter MFP subunit